MRKLRGMCHPTDTATHVTVRMRRGHTSSAAGQRRAVGTPWRTFAIWTRPVLFSLSVLGPHEASTPVPMGGRGDDDSRLIKGYGNLHSHARTTLYPSVRFSVTRPLYKPPS